MTAALAAVQLSLGRTVAVVKPAQTGIGPDEDGDLAEVRRLAGEVSTYEGVRLPDPLAPDTAARLAGRELRASTCSAAWSTGSRPSTT